MSYRRIIISLIITSTVTIYSSILYSAEIDGIFFKDEYSISSVKLPLRGYAILNYMLVIKAYAGALYLRPEIPADQALSETSRILELYYFHKISADDFRTSTAEMIRKNTTSDEFSRIAGQLEIFNAFYRDVNPGDRYRAEYMPGSGLTLYLNGKALGTVNNSGFAKAFFSIWIGKNPIDKKFKGILLGRK